MSEGDYLDDVSDASAVPGANWFNATGKQLCVKVTGVKLVDIKTSPLIIVSFEMPAMSVDEFFGEKIVENLAAFFGISEENIKVAEAIPESRRKRQASEWVSNRARSRSELTWRRSFIFSMAM